MMPLGAGYRPEWLFELSTPIGWRLAHLADRTFEPARIAVIGQHADGRWDGCETVSAFAFTGLPPEEVVRNNADRTLRDLGAVGITSQVVDASRLHGAVAVCSSGYFAAAGLWVWAQYSTYVFGSSELNRGRLIEHTIFIDSACQARLMGDVRELTQSIQRALEGAGGKHWTAQPPCAELCCPQQFFANLNS